MKIKLTLIKIISLVGLSVALNFPAYSSVDCHQLLDSFIAKKAVVESKSLGKSLKLVNQPLKDFYITINKEITQKVFQEAENTFIEKIENPNLDSSLIDLIKNIKNGSLISSSKSSGNLSEEEFQKIFLELKDIRKKANSLRSASIVFTENHESPKQFEEFTKSLGKLNDVLEFKAFESSPEAASRVKKALDLELIEKELKKLKLSKPKDTAKNLVAISEKILKLLKKKNLTVDEFHEVRKEMKHFLAAIQLMKEHDLRPEMEASFKFLEELNDSLGALRDSVLKEEIEAQNKGMKVESSKYQNIPSEYKRAIEDFFNGLSIKID